MSKFIIFEGPDGGGKTTAIQTLSDYLTSIKVDHVTCGLFNDEIGRSIKTQITSGRGNSRCQALLLLSAMQHAYNDVIATALAAGKLVLMDRWFYSTCVYQGLIAEGRQPSDTL
jgi:dTMP kinase